MADRNCAKSRSIARLQRRIRSPCVTTDQMGPQRFDPNPDFLDVVRAAVPEHVPLIVGCKTGPRAELAANLLSQSGYPKVRWVLGGFHGMTDALGNVLAPGWRPLGFPEGRDSRAGASYGALRKKAGKT